VPELVRRDAARQRVLATFGEELVGTRERRLQDPLVDLVLVSPVAARL
jgi:hypothetical protein